MRTRARSCALALLVALALPSAPGCAWTLGVVTQDEHLADFPGSDLIPAMYGTSVHLSAWARVVRGDGEHLITHVLFPLLFLPVFVVDFPLSLAMDVLFLPVTIPGEVTRADRPAREPDDRPGPAAVEEGGEGRQDR